MPSEEREGTRLDRWLWAARFFKTRGLAADAIAGGKVHVNERRVKRAKLVHTSDTVRIRKGPYEYVVVVRQLRERRGSASDAKTLYEETPESVRAREVMASQLKAVARTSFRAKGRPTKRERRDIDRFKRGS